MECVITPHQPIDQAICSICRHVHPDFEATAAAFRADEPLSVAILVRALFNTFRMYTF